MAIERGTVKSPARIVLSAQIPIRIRIEKAILTPARATAIVIMVTVIGAGIRFHFLNVRSLWIDEAASVHFAKMAWYPFLKLLWEYQGNMTLYYFALRGWIHLGDSEFAVRSLSVLFGVLTIPAIYALGRRLFDRATGLIAAALLSVHSFHVAFSQEARGYSVLVLLLVLTAYALVVAMESSRDKRSWLMFAVSAAACVYAHIFGVLALAAQALAVAFPRPFRVQRRLVAGAAVLFGLLISPMAAFVLLHHSDQINWVPRPELSEVSEFLRLLTSQGGIALMAIYFVLCGLAFWPSEDELCRERENWAVRLLGLWLVLPPALTLAASMIKPLFFPRYMVMCVPALVMLAARGVVRLSRMPGVQLQIRDWASAAGLVLVLTLSTWGTSHYFANLSTETSDWRSAVGYVLEHEQPGDGVVLYIPNIYAYHYYTHRAESQHQVQGTPDVLYPGATWRPVSRTEIENDTAGRNRVWLILHMESLNPKDPSVIQSTLTERLRLQDKRKFPGQDLITVELFSGTRESIPAH